MNIYCLRAKGMENKFAAIPASCTPVGETENKHRKKELMKILKRGNAIKK